MKTPSERFHELLDGFDEERIAHLEALAADPNHTRPKVEWRDDPDPFGMDWVWEAPPEARAAASTHPTIGGNECAGHATDHPDVSIVPPPGVDTDLEPPSDRTVAVSDAESARTGTGEQARRAVKIHQPLRGNEDLEADPPPPLPFTRKDKLRRDSQALWWGGRLAALAASLLLGILIGTRVLRDGGRSGATEILIASATPIFDPSRGGGGVEKDWLGIKIDSRLSGFATVVALAPARGPEVHPDFGGDDVPVRSGVPAEVGPLPQSTTHVLFVVTETPAGEPIRRALQDKSFGPGDAAELRTLLLSTLESKGYRRIAFGDTPVDRSSRH